MEFENVGYIDAVKIVADIANYSLIYEDNTTYIANNNFVTKEPTSYEVEYETFDTNPSLKRDANINIGIEKYNELSESNKMMLLYTLLYRFSQGEDKKAIYGYHKNRNANTSHTKLSKLGYIPASKYAELVSYITDKVDCIDDLIKFGIINDSKDTKFPLSFKLSYVKKGGLIVYPSFHLYKTNLVTSFMFRPTHPEQWMKDSNLKEIRMSNSDLVTPLPHGMDYNFVSNKNAIKVIVEGGPDAYCSDEQLKSKDLLFASIPGVNGLKLEKLGLLKDQELWLMLDQDIAGQKATYGYTDVSFKKDKQIEHKIFINDEDGLQACKFFAKEMNKNKISNHQTKHIGLVDNCLKAGVKPCIINWDTSFGRDINDVRNNMIKGHTPFKTMDDFYSNYIQITKI
jgi:hypothetical protein